MNRRSLHNPLLGGSVALAAAVIANPHAVAPAASSLEVTLRWIRLACFSSVNRIMDFWMHVMKMQLDRQIDAGSRVRTCFQFAGDKVGLRVELDSFAKGVPAALQSGQLPTSPTTTVSLVVYVDDCDEYVQRCRDAHFIVFVPTTVVSEEPLIRSAVLLDPSGMKVRLLESELYQIHNKVRTRGRLGYLSVPVKEYMNLEKSIRFYDEIFKPRSSKLGGASSIFMGAANGSTGDHHHHHHHGGGGGHHKTESVSNVANPLSKKHTGFRVVDMERFVEELTTYVWLANGQRKKHTAVCLFHKIQRKFLHQANLTNSSAAAMYGLKGIINQGNNHHSGSHHGTHRGPTTLASSPKSDQKTSSMSTAPSTGGGGVAGSVVSPHHAASGGGHGNSGSIDEDDPYDLEAEVWDDIEEELNSDELKQAFQARVNVLDNKFETQEPEEAKLFLGLSFAVSDIEQAIAFLKETEVGAVAAAITSASINKNDNNAPSGSATGTATPARPNSTAPHALKPSTPAFGGNNSKDNSHRDAATNQNSAPAPMTLAAAKAAEANSFGVSGAKLEIQHIPGFPRFICFNDPSGINIEISDGAMGVGSSLTTIQTTGGGLSSLSHRSSGKFASGSNAVGGGFSAGSYSSFNPSPPSSLRPGAAGGAGGGSGAALYGSRPSSSSRKYKGKYAPAAAAASDQSDGSDGEDYRNPTRDDEWSEDEATMRHSYSAAASDAESVSSDEDGAVGLGAGVASAMGEVGESHVHSSRRRMDVDLTNDRPPPLPFVPPLATGGSNSRPVTQMAAIANRVPPPSSTSRAESRAISRARERSRSSSRVGSRVGSRRPSK